MYREDTLILWEQYKKIFDSDEKKAEAFDKIARNYYVGNFGSMQKSDIEVLMFSLYIEGILNQSEELIDTYSDYTLAKQLGITPSKVGNLKLKKQLQYPYDKFEWKKSFERCCSNARFESGKIKINLRDVNLYYELKNEIEKQGGYVETSLTRNLLIISPLDFFELTSQIMSKEDLDILEKQIKNYYSDNEELSKKLEKEPLLKIIKSEFESNLIDALFDIVNPLSKGAMGVGLNILKVALKAIKSSK